MTPCQTCGLDISSGASDGVRHDWCQSAEAMTSGACFRCGGKMDDLRFATWVYGRIKPICQNCLTAVLIFHEPIVPKKP